MGFEYVYAYLENLEIVFFLGLIVSAVAFIVLILGRVVNEIDGDDWYMLITVDSIALVLFGILYLSPSMDHIKKVRTTALSPYVEKTESKEEVKTDENHAPCLISDAASIVQCSKE